MRIVKAATIIAGFFLMAGELHAAGFGETIPPMGYAEFCATAGEDCTLPDYLLRRAVLTPDRPADPYLAREDTALDLKPVSDAELRQGPEAASYPVAIYECEAALITKKCYLDSLPRPDNWLFDTASLESRDIGSPIYKRVGLLPRGGGFYQIGRPYKVAGLSFTPAQTASYDEVGTASWYGRRYHSRMTSNGEWFDMEYLTAAHPTLPLPSYAKVTNLDNGQELIVRINDRGPFVAGRLIDVSKKAAELLGFKERGTAKVRVQYMGLAPLNDQGADLSALNLDLAHTRALERAVEEAAAAAKQAPPLVVADAGPIMNF